VQENRRARALTVVARMAPGVGIERARTELATIANRLHAEHPADYPVTRGFSIGNSIAVRAQSFESW